MVPGVRRVAKLVLMLEGETYAPCTDVAVDANVLLRSGVHEISVRYE